jgi:hypothetical protein
MIDPSGWYTVSEAKNLLFGGKLSLRAVYHLLSSRQIPHHKAGGKILLLGSDMIAFMAGSKVQPPAADEKSPPVKEEVIKVSSEGFRHFKTSRRA